jgi:hypothetical protein
MMLLRPTAFTSRFAGHALMMTLFAMLVFILAVPGVEAAEVAAKVGTDAAERCTTLFPIVRDRKLGFIDQRGQVVLEPVFALSHVGGTRTWPPQPARVLTDNPSEEIYDSPGAYPVSFPAFHDGVVIVSKDDRIGYVRRDGKILSSPTFLAGADFAGGVAWAQSQDNTYCLLNTEGRTLREGVEECAPFEEGLAPIRIGGKYGYIDRRATMIIVPQFDSASPFSEGVACVMESGQQWLIDCQGRRIAQIEGRLERFSEGLAVAYDRTTKKYGYIDTCGKPVIAPQFGMAAPFHEGLAAVEMGEKYGFINRQGSFAIEPKFVHASAFVNGRATVQLLDPERPDRVRQGIVNRAGDYVVKPAYGWIGPTRDGFTIVKTTDGSFGLLDIRGQFVLEPRFRAMCFADDSRLVARTREVASLFDCADMRSLPGEYFDISPTLKEGLRRVVQAVNGQGKYGFVDEWGHLIISPRFDYAEDFEGGLARVAMDIDCYIPSAFAVLGGKWGYIDKQGNWIWNPTR